MIIGLRVGSDSDFWMTEMELLLETFGDGEAVFKFNWQRK